jgi:hypothetical protein
MKGSSRAALFVLVLALAATIGMITPSSADRVMIGTSSGEIFGRDEYNLAPHIASSYINFGTPIGKLAAANGKVVIGLNASGSANVFTRPVDNMAANLSTLTQGTTNSAITAMALRGTDTVVVGQTAPSSAYWSGSFVRKVDNLDAAGTGYLGGSVPTPQGDGWNWGLGITAMSCLSDGRFVVGCDSGMVTVRSATDIFAYPAGQINGWVNLGSPIVGVAGIGSNYAVLLQNGFIGAQPGNDCYSWVSYVNYGMTATALASFGDGRVAIGFANGLVDIRNISSLTTSLGISCNFGSNIGALAVTTDGNLVVGSGSQVFVRRGSDLTLTPAAYAGSDGLNFGSTITALAPVAVPEPSSLAALALGFGGMLTLKRRRR